ncbi:PAS domain-containing sensor histidine kinase [Pontibacter sp. G13]|uniref:PAS domain-containing sensor histidine kinase n=1 Tax=Pontibacter sp. G13 TaxID=3074898 RepID=UPI0028891EEF|nr:PAS domain-containing sensor histidine kinase [Pontibacter sp. G13]WNJ21169.1 PAS domain-containing sensor histidine kinase [Pontibacter sp. G13]
MLREVNHSSSTQTQKIRKLLAELELLKDGYKQKMRDVFSLLNDADFPDNSGEQAMVDDLWTLRESAYRQYYDLLTGFSASPVPNPSPAQTPIKYPDLDATYAMIQQAPTPLLILDLDLRVEEINPAGQSLLKVSLGIDLRPGTRLMEAIPEAVQGPWKSIFYEVLSGSAKEETLQFVHQEELQSYEISCFPLKDSTGTIQGVAAIGRNITSWVKSHSELKQKDRMFSSIAQSIREGIFRIFPDTGIRFMNLACVEMFGYVSVDEMKGISPNDLFAQPHGMLRFSALMESLGELENEEVEFLRKDGSTFWGLISCIKTDRPDGQVCYDGAIRDITPQREAQDHIEAQNAQLQKINRELDQFVYSTTHDLRAPLASIQGLITVSKMADTPEDQRKYLDLMERSVEKLDAFIKKVVGYSRNSRGEIQYEPVDICLMAEEIFQGLAFGPGAEHIQASVTQSGAGRMVTDRSRMEVLLKNLISNSFQYANVDQERPFVHVHLNLTATHDILTVADNGKGIDPRFRDRVFNMFFRASNESSGSGLGLYIVKEIVEKLQGKIELKSQLGEGTTFTLTFPKQVPSNETAAPHQAGEA